LKPSAELTAFAKRLGHEFQQPELLIRAMTHSSLSSGTRGDNQRLEFLGDRVLGLAISDALYRKDCTASEGQLAPRFNALVRKETCAEVAQSIQLGDALKMGRSEMISGGRRKIAILGDAMEAVIGAVYQDAGFDVARSVIVDLWQVHIDNAADDARDAKTTLQEWAQARKQTPPKYVEIKRSGPDHAPIFTIEVRLESGQSAQARAASKRAASQEAAADLLSQLESET
tara:strand:+ start:29112 stop:29798 length:687 start_codon:yes stop_codon:yes gene_type:complete